MRSGGRAPEEPPRLKQRTARTLKWNTIDRFGSQVLYAVVGIVLANVLSQADFGLVGAILVFQAFATIFVDSGFGAALLQKKDPTQADYSTTFWFNLLISILIYGALFAAAPLIADIFGDARLVVLSRVMFLSFILNGLSIVQTNRLMKRMNVKQIAVGSIISLTASGIVGVALALKGFGAWALVWQTIANTGIKSGWLWLTGGWTPSAVFSRKSLRSIWRVGAGVFSSSFLNTLSLNIYPFVIGAFHTLSSLGLYTQADKWSKMGTASISQILTASFVPVLSGVQDDGATFRRYVGRIDRFAAFIIFPAMGALVCLGYPLFHTLFGHKWDEAVPLFRILAFRGIFVVLISLYTNYLLSLGKARLLVITEFIKDALLIGAIFATAPFGTVEALVWGQMAASALTFIIMLLITARASGISPARMLADLLPYMFTTLAAMAGAWGLINICGSPIIQLSAGAGAGIIIYCAILRIAGSRTYIEAEQYILGRLKYK